VQSVGGEAGPGRQDDGTLDDFVVLSTKAVQEQMRTEEVEAEPPADGQQEEQQPATPAEVEDVPVARVGEEAEEPTSDATANNEGTTSVPQEESEGEAAPQANPQYSAAYQPYRRQLRFKLVRVEEEWKHKLHTLMDESKPGNTPPQVRA
jgi:hypothetical protein